MDYKINLSLEIMNKVWFSSDLAVLGIKGTPELGMGTMHVIFLVKLRGVVSLISAE